MLGQLFSALVELYYVLLEPLLVRYAGFSYGLGDATYGRDALPYSDYEKENIYENPEVRVVRRKVFLSHGTPILEAGLEEKVDALPTKHNNKPVTGWINYYIWELANAPPTCTSDLLTCACRCAQRLMKAGFRTIAIDMPSFGRSTGLQAYLPSMMENPEALDAVMRHVRFCDAENGDTAHRFRFAQGSSMGGFTALYHAALNPPISPESLGGPAFGTVDRVSLDGVAVTAPMLRIAPESLPHPIVQFVAHIIMAIGGGRLALARAIRGNVSDDPRVEEYARQDPQVYQGYVRVSTGLNIVIGLQHLDILTPQIRCPVSLHHGANDRVTSPEGTRIFYELLQTKKKKIRVWPGIEHVMLKNLPDMSAADIAKREEILDDITQFFLDIVHGTV
ncbi:acylglycerol lipase [Malassezia cuniculi]|uniref:Acylglycerol lipase n=1 Tax=Malassezia cuniculi TaxID=948313 RepID=A0AAF0JCE8_9BASI|nr:acylglycerol lipase [Malassezia cuniculi]